MIHTVAQRVVAGTPILEPMESLGVSTTEERDHCRVDLTTEHSASRPMSHRSLIAGEDRPQIHLRRFVCYPQIPIAFHHRHLSLARGLILSSLNPLHLTDKILYLILYRHLSQYTMSPILLASHLALRQQTQSQ
jgi:hypothetical protein